MAQEDQSQIEIQLYHCDIILTSDQEQEDYDHGIFQRGKRRLNIDWTNKQFELQQDYYYEYQNSGYQLKVQKKLVINFTGKFQEQKNSKEFKCTVSGKYMQNYTVHSQKTNIDINNARGILTLRRNGNGFNVTDVKMVDQKQNPFKCILQSRPTMVYTKFDK